MNGKNIQLGNIHKCIFSLEKVKKKYFWLLGFLSKEIRDYFLNNSKTHILAIPKEKLKTKNNFFVFLKKKMQVWMLPNSVFLPFTN